MPSEALTFVGRSGQRQIHHNLIDQMLLKYPIYIMFRTTKSTNSHYFALQSSKTYHRPYRSQLQYPIVVGVTGSRALLLLAGTSIRCTYGSAINARPEILTLTTPGYFNVVCHNCCKIGLCMYVSIKTTPIVSVSDSDYQL